MAVTRAPIESLSPRQSEVLELIAKGLTNDDIARVLGMTRATARTHVAAILQRLHVDNRTEAASLYVAWAAAPAQVRTIIARPAIAVLPLCALDDDAASRSLGAGLAHDLASLFARWCWFPVIAHSSVVAARSLGTTCGAIGRALGARFIVDGSVRRAGDRLRIVVQLDDVDEGTCLWSARFDVSCAALFEVQDEVCCAVVATAYPLLIERVGGGLASQNDLAAWELAHHGMALQAQRDEAASREARRAFEAALERDATLALAHFGLGLCAYDDVLNQWAGPEATDRLIAAADRCLRLSPHGAEGHYLMARHHQTHGDYGLVARALEHAITNNPSFATAHALLAQALSHLERDVEALERMRHAQRLGPRAFAAGLAALLFTRHDYAEALAASEETLALRPRYTFARTLAVAAAYWLGERERAEKHLGLLRRDHPRFDLAGFVRTFGPRVDAVLAIERALVDLAG